MATITLKFSHLCIVNLIMLSKIMHVIQSTPLCSRLTNGSMPKNDDRIYFIDSQTINETMIRCLPDETSTDRTKMATTHLETRVQSGN